MASSARSSRSVTFSSASSCALEPDAGEEHLLVQPQPAAADEDQPGDRGHARHRQVVDDDRRHPVHARVGSEQGAAQDPGRLLQQRMPEVDVDQVAALARGLVVEGDRPPDARVQPGVQADQRRLPLRPERRNREDLGVGVLVADRVEQRLRGHGQGGVDHPARVRGGEVHGLLARGIRGAQLGELRG